MKLTDRAKWGIATVAIPVLAAALLYVYAILPEKEDIPPATGEVREIAPSWVDRALSAYYERKTDEPIVAIIRQDIEAQVGAISPDGQFIATGGSFIRDVAISSVAEKRIVRKLAIDSGSVRVVAYSPDGRYLVAGRAFMANIHHNASVNIWDAQSGKLIRNLSGPAGPGKIENDVTALAFSPDGRTLAVSYFPQPNKGDSVHLFDVSTGERLRVMHPSSSVNGSLAFFDGGKYLGCLGYGEEFIAYEVSSGKRVQQMSDHATYALSPDGQYLAKGTSRDKILKIIDRKTGRDVKVLGTAKGYYRVLAYSPDGRYLAVYSDGSFVLWDISAGKIVRELKGQPDIVGYGIGFDAGGCYVAAVCNKYIVMWDFKKLISTARAD
jgi:WD40 repeat protein